MNGSRRRLLVVFLALIGHGVPSAQTIAPLSPDDLYAQREDLRNAARAADIWAARAAVDFEAAWKLARVCYWLGTHDAQRNQRSALDRGVHAGEAAVRLARDRPEGHFWLAANMGRLAESFGLTQALRYRGRIKSELERALAIDPAWQGGSADDALGQWYATVPRLFGGSDEEAERHLRRALDYDPHNLSALLFLAEMVADQGKRDEARALLQRVIEAPFDPEWAPENREFQRKAAARLKQTGG